MLVEFALLTLVWLLVWTFPYFESFANNEQARIRSPLLH